jgi:hypothetical protein
MAMQQRLLSLCLALLCAVLAACGGARSDNGPAPVSNTNPTAAVAFGAAVKMGADQQLHATVGSRVDLNGIGSTDPNGDALSFAWTLVSKPNGSAAVASATGTATASFTPDVIGSYTVRLTVSDGKGGSSSQDVSIVVDNQPPTSNLVISGIQFFGISAPAGTHSISTNTFIVLDGTGSTDPQGDTVTVTWTLNSAPAGSTATLDTSTPGIGKLLADVLGTYVITGRATDSRGAWVERVFTFVADNQPPNPLVSISADPNATGRTYTLALGYDLLLDASGTTDADGDPMTFQWTVVQAPSGSTAALSSDTGTTSTFTPDQLGTYKIKLEVRDSKGALAVFVLTLNVNNTRPTPSAVPQAIPTAPLDVPVGTIVVIRGTDSVSASGNPLAYAWTLLSRPLNSGASITAGQGDFTLLTPDVAGSYVVQLRATDTVTGAYDESVLTIQAGNTAPNAVLSPATAAGTAHVAVALSAAGSSDAEGDTLTYAWWVDSAPVGSAYATGAALPVPDALHPELNSFTPDVSGSYVIRVDVSDGHQTRSAYSVITVP